MSKSKQTKVLCSESRRSYFYRRSAQRQAIATYINFEYNFNATTGNLNYRKDVTRNITENFSYDNLNRLTGFAGQTVNYDANGNITQKSGIGNYHYLNNAKPYALTGIVQSGNVIPERQQQITYASFSRPLTITEDGYSAQFTYEAGGDRVTMQVTQNGAWVLTRHYLANQYELDEKPGSTREKLYLGGDYYSAGAVLVRDNGGAWQVFYINSDYLGSVTRIVNSAGTVLAEYSYDAWGRLRNPVTHAIYGDGQQPELFLGRGYTGHEHLNWFGLINMNARLYDPVHGRFLAPDPYVQAPDFTQSFNRYGYAWGNPLIYTDPDGEFIFTALLSVIPGIGTAIGAIIDAACWGAVIGGGVYTASAALSPGGLSQNWNSNNFWRSVGIGAVSGAVTGGMGLLAPSFSVSSTSFSANLPTYLGKAGWASLTAITATGAGMLTNDWLDDGKINTPGRNYLKGMGLAGLTAGMFSFGGSVYDYSTWDKLSATEKMTKIQNKFGSNVQYDPTASDYGYYKPGATDVYLGPAALNSKALAYTTARHELKHLSDWKKYTAGTLSIPSSRGAGFAGVKNHFEIRAYKHEMQYFRITSREYINNYNFIKTNYGYRGFGNFIPNPFGYTKYLMVKI